MQGCKSVNLSIKKSEMLGLVYPVCISKFVFLKCIILLKGSLAKSVFMNVNYHGGKARDFIASCEFGA